MDPAETVCCTKTNQDVGSREKTALPHPPVEKTYVLVNDVSTHAYHEVFTLIPASAARIRVVLHVVP